MAKGSIDVKLTGFEFIQDLVSIMEDMHKDLPPEKSEIYIERVRKLLESKK